MTDVIAASAAKSIADVIKTGIPYSIIIDESTDLGKTKYLAIVVRLYSTCVV